MAVLVSPQLYGRDMWVPRFAMRLRERRPAVAGTVAMDIADSVFDLSSDVLPEEAADAYVDEAPPGEFDDTPA